MMMSGVVQQLRGYPKYAQVTLFVVIAAFACHSTEQVVERGLKTSASDSAAALSAPEETAEAQPDASNAGEYENEDFVEGETNRDPFKNYLALVPGPVKTIPEPTRPVVMPETAIEDMRLIGIVSGAPWKVAMVVDTGGVGHVVQRGMFIGRTKLVPITDSDSFIQLNWRIARIYRDKLILTRDDPNNPSQPPLVKEIRLHDETPKRNG